MQGDAGMYFVNTVDNKQALVAVNELKRAFKQVQQQASDTGSTIDGVMNKLAAATGITVGAATIKELATQVMNLRGEFQKLEIAFGTMLGSAEKANALMQQLTKTAATTPFDLKSVAGGAKQLLAYGIAAEEVNKTLINLGDIAAGLSIPLNDMVMLYGTTMVQGRMFTQDLRQFMGRGIPIAQALADTMGVAKEQVQELVSTGKVGAQEFQTALMSLVAEGGQFGGLMEKQSKSISGQISNIEDGIDMMFNKIGQKSEGFINASLSVVSKLIENYETVGKAILALAGTYGTYKTALVIVSAVEKAHQAVIAKTVTVKRAAAIANIALSETDAMAAARKAIFTKAIKANTKALLANAKAMLTNPAVLITAGLVALCAAIIAVTRALDSQARAQERVNDLQEKQKQQRDDTKSEADQAIHTIQSETATVYEKAKAYNTLKKIMPELTNQYSQAELATIDLTKAQKAEAAALENMEFSQMADEIGKSEKRIKGLEEQLAVLSKTPNSGFAMGEVGIQLKTEREFLRQIKQEYADMQKVREQARFDAQPVEIKVAAFKTTKAELEKQLDDFVQKANEAAAMAKKKWEQDPLNEWKIKIGMTFEEDAAANPALLGGEYSLLQPVIDGLQKQIQETDGQIAALSTTATKETLPDIIGAIHSAEEAVRKARINFANDASQTNKTAVENAEEAYKTATDNYKLATGKVWSDTKKLEEEITKARQQALNERQRILNSSIQAERVQREAAYWQTIAEINQEEAAFRKANNGRTSSAFKLKRENAEIQLQLDEKEFERRFNEWKKGFEKETLQISIDTKSSQLQNAISMSQTITERIQKQNELYEHQISLIRSRNQAEADKAVSDKYGENTLNDFRAFSADEKNAAVLSSYRNAKTPENKKKVANDAGIKEELLATYAEMEQVYEMYTARLDATIQQAEQGHNFEMLRQDIDDYTQYCEEIVEAAKWREEQLAAISSGEEKNRTKDMVEKDYQTMVKQSGQKHDIDTTEKEAADIVTRLIGSLEDVTYDQIDVAATEFFGEIDKQLEMLKQARAMTDEQRASAEQSATEELQGLQEQAEDPLLTEEQRLEINTKIAEVEQRILYFKMTEQQLDGRTNKLLSSRKIMENSVANAKQKSGKKTIKQIQKEQRATENVVNALSDVSNAAKSVADTMGGILSTKSKKALGIISDVADFGMQAIQSIQYVATSASTLMEATAVGAAGAIQTVEKASVILTIISLAVQAIMAIVNIAKQFTTNAKVNEELDKMAEKIERLKEEQRDLDFMYRNSVGSDYFKNQYNAAKQVEKQIKANREAYIKSLREEERLRREYGTDSDKYKDQHDRTQEFKEAWEEAITDEEERFQELIDEILTTDLSGWADSLADSAIDAALDGSKSFKEIWNEALEDWERDMYKQQLKLAYENLFKDSFERFANMAEEVAALGGSLTEHDMDMFIAELESKEEEAARITEMYRELMEKRGLLTDNSDVEGSQGGFDSMTSDQADELSARFTALQVEGANVVAAAQAMQALLEDISTNDHLRLGSLQNIQSNIDLAVTIQQNQLDQLRTLVETSETIAVNTARLRAIEQNTDRL